MTRFPAALVLVCAVIMPGCANRPGFLDMPGFARKVTDHGIVTCVYAPRIMGEGRSAPAQCAAFLMARNTGMPEHEALYLATLYYSEATRERVNHDIAFIQMCLETAFQKYGGQVKKEQNNFCGLGAVDGGAQGASFETPVLGVRAHIQHLKAYASEDGLVAEVVDPRFKYVKRGISPLFYGLAGKWASDQLYGMKLERLLVQLYLSMDS